MMRSRALPDDFDMAQALHAPFGNSHGLGTPLASPAAFGQGFPDSAMMRPLSIDTLRRATLDSHMSPTGISPAFGGFQFTPPQSATDTLSPVSAHDSPFGFPSAPLDTSPRTSNPFSIPVSTPTSYSSHHSIPRLTLHGDRITRTRAGTLDSPLRTSMSYSHSSDLTQASLDSSSHSEASRAFSSSMMPYGVGYSCKSTSDGIFNIELIVSDAPIPGFQASSSNRMRSFSNGVPRRIELSTHYTPSRSTSTPQTAQFPSYSSAPLVTPVSYGMPQLSAPHNLSTFPSSYLRNDSAHNDHYSGVSSSLRDMLEHSEHGNDDHRY
jgi:hypothetical protein